MNWKEQYKDRFAEMETSSLWYSQIESFISTEIIEKLIADIPEGQLFDEDNNIYDLRTELRDKWL